MHPYVLLRDQLPKSKGQKSQAFSFWIFTPGIALESWKILSGNFLFLELKNPGKFCPGRKLSWNFLKIIYIFPGIYSYVIFHSWNFPLLEFCPGTFCSWNLISRNFLVTLRIGFLCCIILGFWQWRLYSVYYWFLSFHDEHNESLLIRLKPSNYWEDIQWYTDLKREELKIHFFQALQWLL